MMLTIVSFMQIDRRVFDEKTRRSLLKFGNNLSKIVFIPIYSLASESCILIS